MWLTGPVPAEGVALPVGASLDLPILLYVVLSRYFLWCSVLNESVLAGSSALVSSQAGWSFPSPPRCHGLGRGSGRRPVFGSGWLGEGRGGEGRGVGREEGRGGLAVSPPNGQEQRI